MVNMTEEDTFLALKRVPANQVFKEYFSWRNLNEPKTGEEKDKFVADRGWTWKELIEQV